MQALIDAGIDDDVSVSTLRSLIGQLDSKTRVLNDAVEAAKKTGGLSADEIRKVLTQINDIKPRIQAIATGATPKRGFGNDFTLFQRQLDAMEKEVSEAEKAGQANACKVEVWQGKIQT